MQHFQKEHKHRLSGEKMRLDSRLVPSLSYSVLPFKTR